MSFRYYNPDEVILGKPMKDQLKFAMSYWHTMCADGTDMFGCGTNVKTYGETDPMELAKAKAHAAFEFMNNALHRLLLLPRQRHRSRRRIS